MPPKAPRRVSSSAANLKIRDAQLVRRAIEQMRQKRTSSAMPPHPAPVAIPPPSGRILPGVKLIPLADVAARWKVSELQLREAINSGTFKLVVTKQDTITDYWFLEVGLWPHGNNRTVVPERGIVHTLLPGARFDGALNIFIPRKEVRRVEEDGQIPAKRIAVQAKDEIAFRYSIKDLCFKFNKSSSTIRRYKDDKKLGRKIGGTWRFSDADVRAITNT